PALPEPCPVEMQRRAADAGCFARRHQVVPRRKLPAKVALRQLEQKHRDRLAQLLNVVRLDQPLTTTEQGRPESVQYAVRTLLVRFQVALRMERDHTASR